jgi:hypothetical protein
MRSAGVFSRGIYQVPVIDKLSIPEVQIINLLLKGGIAF